MAAQKDDFLISYLTLRRLIGYLGILLPFLCWSVNALFNHINLLNNPLFVDESQSAVYIAGADLKSSISRFYYTTAGPLFIGVMTTVAIFLFCYKGYREREEDRFSWLTDKLVTTFAACCALGIVVFPTGSTDRITDNLYIFVTSELVGKIHLGFAAAFFFSMALMSIINFRRQPGKQLLKNVEGRLYLVCGWGIIVCLLLLLIKMVFADDKVWLWGHFVYILEVFMLLFFGISWLVKGKNIVTGFLLRKIDAVTSN